MEDNAHRNLSFEEAERRFGELQRRFRSGAIGEEEFDEQRKRLMVRDSTGRWWAKSRETGEWRYRTDAGWVRGTPPIGAGTGSGGGKSGLLIGGGFAALVVVVLLFVGLVALWPDPSPQPDPVNSSQSDQPSESPSDPPSDPSSSSNGGNQNEPVADPASDPGQYQYNESEQYGN